MRINNSDQLQSNKLIHHGIYMNNSPVYKFHFLKSCFISFLSSLIRWNNHSRRASETSTRSTSHCYSTADNERGGGRTEQWRTSLELHSEFWDRQLLSQFSLHSSAYSSAITHTCTGTRGAPYSCALSSFVATSVSSALSCWNQHTTGTTTLVTYSTWVVNIPKFLFVCGLLIY